MPQKQPNIDAFLWRSALMVDPSNQGTILHIIDIMTSTSLQMVFRITVNV